MRHRIRLTDETGPPSRRRCGSMLLETGVAAALLVTIMGMLIPVLARTSEKHRQVDQRELALGAVANLLEHAALLSPPTRESLQPIADQLITDQEIPEPEWRIVVTPEQNPSLNRVEATLSWQSRPLVRHSVTLVRWYRGEAP